MGYLEDIGVEPCSNLLSGEVTETCQLEERISNSDVGGTPRPRMPLPVFAKLHMDLLTHFQLVQQLQDMFSELFTS